MACATLKRSLDWDPLNSPSNSSSGTKSVPTSAHRPAKRRCLFLNQPHVSPPKQASPFNDLYPKYTSGLNFKTSSKFYSKFYFKFYSKFYSKCESNFKIFHLFSEEIAINIKEEMKKLYNRKQLNFSSSNPNNSNNQIPSTSSQLDLNTSNG